MLASFEKGIIASRKVVAAVTFPMSASLSSPSLLYSCACRLYNSRSTHRHRHGEYNQKLKFSPSSPGSNEGGRGGGQSRWTARENALTPVKAGKGKKGKINLTRNYQEKEDSRHQQAMDMNMDEYRQHFKREIQEHGDPMDEPDPSLFSKQFDDYVQETKAMKEKIKTMRQTKKHFGNMNPFHKELSLLTWAEKETIRYLHDSDPEHWTPDTIAEAFPISPQGVTKLVRGSMRLRTVKEVVQHDTNIAQRMKDINAGVIPMTEELEQRLKIRDLCGPLKVGDLGMNPHQYVDTSLPKKLGEFASLVAPPPPKVVKKEEEKKSVVTYFADGEFYNPGEYNNRDLDLAQDSSLKHQLSENELQKLLPVAKRMTFSEFEHRLETKQAGRKAGDMKYMLEEIEHPNPTLSSTSSPEEIELPFAEEDTTQFLSNIQKYKRPEDTGQMVEVKVEGEQAYLYQDTTGYQKPYGPSSNNVSDGSSNGEKPTPLKIVIPEKFYGRPGATFKVGDCYYDENGDFLYKVV